MNNLKKIFIGFFLLLLAISVTYILICRNIFQEVEQQTNKALNDYSMLPNNQKIVNKVVLGDRRKKLFWSLNYRIKNAALELVCTNQGNIILVMKDDVRPVTIIEGASLFVSSRIENGIFKSEAKIEKMDFIDSGYLDTMVSNSLSNIETNAIIKALEERNSNHIGIGLDNGGYAFVGNANISDVKELITKCTPSNNN